MTLAFFLKILSDLCFYTCFSAFFAGLSGLEGTVLPQLALAAAAAAFSRGLWAKKTGALRFLPLALLVLCFVLPGETPGRVILIPPAVYVLWTVFRCRFDLGYFSAADVFSWECKILPLPALFALVLGQSSLVERFSVPYFLVFALSSILLLRMLRHDEETLRQPRFRLMNGLSILGLCLVCGVVGSELFRNLLGLVLKAVWKVLSIPALLILGGVGAGMIWLLDSVLPDELNFEGIKQEALEFPTGTEDLWQDQLTEQTGDPSRAVLFVISGLLIALAVLAAVLLFRKLAASRRTEEGASSQQRRFAASAMPPPQRPLTRLSARTPDLQVRYWYQQLLRKTRQEGGELRADMDTRQQNWVEEDIFPKHRPAVTRLRQLYLPARYNGRATEQDAKEAKDLYRQIKK